MIVLRVFTYFVREQEIMYAFYLLREQEKRQLLGFVQCMLCKEERKVVAFSNVRRGKYSQ